ncbi:MAG: N-acetylmuramoyl-L-alanine amidase [Actinomycetota bacterium]
MKRVTVSIFAFALFLVLGLGIGPAEAGPSRAVNGKVAIRGVGSSNISTRGVEGGFNLVGAVLPAGSQVPNIEIRTSNASGWSAWQGLEFDPDEGPDGTGQPIGSTPIWVGDASGFQIRSLSSQVDKVNIHWVRSRDNKRVTLSLGARFISHSVASPSKPAIITRAGWGADESIRQGSPSYASTLKMAFIHHTAGTNNYAASESASIVRGIYNYHVVSRGWSDIGYNFLVDKYGQIFEGRFGGIDKSVIGSHAGGFNTGSTGISLMGEFSSSPPTAQLEDSLDRLLAWKLDVHHIDPHGTSVMRSGGSTRYAEGTLVTLANISGHRDVSTTSCPGEITYGRLPAYSDQAYGMGLPKMFDSAYIPQSGSSPARFVARFSETMNWQANVTRRLDATQARKWVGTGGSFDFTWDGKDASGIALQTGAYLMQISGSSSSGAVTPYEGLKYVVNEHPNGSVVMGPDGRAWMLELGKKRHIISPAILESRIRWSEIISVRSSEIERYPTGPPLGFRDGTLIFLPDGSVWLISNGLRRHIKSPAIFDQLGYEWWNVKISSMAEAQVHSIGTPISDSLARPDGSPLMGPDGSVYVLDLGFKRHLPSPAVFESRFRWAELVMVSSQELMIYPSAVDLGFRDGSLIHSTDGSVHVIEDGSRRHIASPDLFTVMGYLWGNVLGAYHGETALHPAGQPIG